jgi:hypothetical protein
MVEVKPLDQRSEQRLHSRSIHSRKDAVQGITRLMVDTGTEMQFETPVDILNRADHHRRVNYNTPPHRSGQKIL